MILRNAEPDKGRRQLAFTTWFISTTATTMRSSSFAEKSFRTVVHAGVTSGFIKFALCVM